MPTDLPRLILHVGHAKTGSSALQAQLAQSVERLASEGITYPWHPAMKLAQKEHISTGNVDPDGVVAAYDAACAAHPDATTFLFSNEALTSRHFDTAAPFAELIARGVSIDMVLFIRNPLSHALSIYGQEVKRGGAVEGVDTRLALYGQPGRIGQFLDLQRAAGVRVHVANYSNHRRNLSAQFCRMINLPKDILTPLEVRQVNRSLTKSELYVQRAFNREWGASSNAFVSDQLCNRLPDIRAERPYITPAQYDAFAQRMRPMLEEVNPKLPPNEAYVLESYDDLFGQSHPLEAIQLSPEQVDVLVASISARLPKRDETEAFFDLVTALRAGAPLDDAGIEGLTRMARALRPGSKRLNVPALPRKAPERAGFWARLGLGRKRS